MTTQLATDSTVVVEGDPLTTELEGELVILDGQSGTYYGLNEVGRMVWELIEESRSIADVRDAIAAEYDVDRERVEEDVIDVLDDLESKGLVRVEE